MALSKETIIDHLKRIYPDRHIYKMKYNAATLTVQLHYSIRSQAKAEGMTVAHWLVENGFQWHETGYIENCMRSGNRNINKVDSLHLADSIMRNYPLAGQYEPTEEEMVALLSEAQNVFRKFYSDTATVKQNDQLIITVATIQLLKSWSSDIKKETEDRSFWDYIYLQYGFKAEDDDETKQNLKQKIYKEFRKAIKDTLIRYKRFMAPEGTMRYYTSMLLHAIAPNQSIFALFDTLFNFYIQNLDYQYVPDDIVYGTLVKGMQAKLSDNKGEDSLNLQSKNVMSGLKTLFLECPGYMAVTCDRLVYGIDTLVRTASYEPEDRWDSLLLDWYKEKSRIDRTRVQGEKHNHKTEFVATSSERIYMRYVLNNNRVGIQIPRIRLSSVEENRPIVTIYQGNNIIYRSEMSVSGNDLGLTTRQIFIPLENTSYDFSSELKLCGEIEYAREVLYTSGTRMYRNCIIFDSDGMEREVKHGTAFLFANDICEFEFSNEDGVFAEDHPGQLLRINLDQVGTVTANGSELFADEQKTGRIRMYPSVREVNGIVAEKDGMKYRIFSKPFAINLHLPTEDNPLSYQVMLDGSIVSNAEVLCEEGKLVFSVSEDAHVTHNVRINHIVDSTHIVTVLELNYIILPGFRYTLDKPLYYESDDRAELTLNWAGQNVCIPTVRAEESDEATTGSVFEGFFFTVSLPAVHATFGETNLFKTGSVLWYDSVDKSVTTVLTLPSGWDGKLMLGANVVDTPSKGLFEIGNFLHSGRTFGEKEPLWLSLVSLSGSRIQFHITDVYFKPVFIDEPLTIDSGVLYWTPESAFVGSSDSSFRITLITDSVMQFDVNSDNSVLLETDQMVHGFYSYSVSIKERTLFSKAPDKIIYRSKFCFGNRNEFRFNNKELVLTSAIYWNFNTSQMEEATMLPSAGILERLEYIGESVPSGENVSLLEYEATLLYETADGRRIPFNDREDNEKYEYINPVRIWVVNERKLVLRCVSDDAVYFDSQYNSIVNKNPELTMSKVAQRLRLQTPDYFEYEIREV